MRRHHAAGRWISAVVLCLAFILPVFADSLDTDLAFLMEASAPSRYSTAPMPSMVRPILTVILFGVLLWGVLYLMYRRRKQEISSDLIHVLVSSPIAQGVIVQIVDVGGILFVLSISREGVTTLGQITEREKISEIRTRLSQENLSMAIPAIPFQKALQKLFQKTKGHAGAEAAGARPAAREKILQEALERVRRLNPAEKKGE